MPGRFVGSYISSMSEQEYEETFFGGRGKGKGKGHRKGIRSSGKGKGRTRNPVGKDGKVMECFIRKPNGQKCGSTHHLAKECPHRQSGKGSHSAGKGVETTNLAIEYAEVDDAQIEDLKYADDVFVHVMSEDDGSGPLIIMIDEDAGPLEPMEDDGVWDTGLEPI